MINIFSKTITALSLIFVAMCCFNIEKAAAQPGAEVTMQTFYDELEPYGQWIDDPQYGYVWSPDAGPDFKPYATNGHWVETQYGNTWVSDYDWGWAPFHYGRWRFAQDYGWEWIPGTEWGPAWVNWRTGGDFYGWAPLGPGIDIDVSFGSGYYAPDNYWVFVPRQYICSPNPYRYYLPASRNFGIIRNTTIINNVYNDHSRRYISGPRPADLQRYTQNSVTVYNINNRNRPGVARIRNNTLNLYRPQIASNGNNNQNLAPNRVINRGTRDGMNGGIRNNNPGINIPKSNNNQGNTSVQGNNPANNNGFGRNRNGGSTNNNQFPQRSISNPAITNGNTQNSVVNGANGNNTSGGFNRPVRVDRPNSDVQNQNGQPGNNGRISRDFDINRPRADNLQMQQQRNQQRQQQEIQNQQRQQQKNQQELQHNQQQEIQNQQRQQQVQEQRSQQQQQRNQQQEIQNQQRQQQQQVQQQKNQQESQQRQQQEERTQQRPVRQDRPERRSE